ncbi:MAG TPA: hypothetical protein VG964_01540 [Candidatus Saccharimonadales bacterium]|nr:hypothetical protein [Candidatus Saccharimonadales bacterium]
MAAKTKKWNRLVAEAVFWLHVLILIVISLLGLFVAWYWVIIVLVLVKLQQLVFHGCLLTLLEVKERNLKKGTPCFYLAFKRFFGIRLSKRGVYWVSILQNLLAIAVALLATLFNIRLHI